MRLKMKDTILKTKNLTKKYKDFVALDNVNIDIKKGDIYGLIGRNGAGKTTLMKIIATLSNKTSGSFELFGNNDNELTSTKRRIGCLIENPAFFPNLSAYNNLKYYAIQKGIVNKEQIDEVINLVGLTEVKDKKFKTYSLGMKQRLGIAFAILDNPDFILLDEPINGLDPIGISELRDTLKKINEERNVTILISSHILNELNLVANKFGIIEKGRILKELTKEELDAECSKCIVIKTKDVNKAAITLEKELKTKNYKVVDNTEIRLYDYLDNSIKVNRVLIKNDIDIISLYETGITLEDYFKSVIKEGI